MTSNDKPTDTPSRFRAYVFEKSNGDRFIFPSHILWGDERETRGRRPMSALDLMFESMALSLSLGVKHGDEMESFESAKFIHYETTATSPGFMHGGATAYLFAGPSFDEMMATQAEKKDA